MAVHFLHPLPCPLAVFLILLSRFPKVDEALISDLNSRGHSKLTLRENGDICIEQGEDAVSQEHLNNFPQKVYWPRLAEVLESNGLAAEVTAQGIQVSW